MSTLTSWLNYIVSLALFFGSLKLATNLYQVRYMAWNIPQHPLAVHIGCAAGFSDVVEACLEIR
jgi:hypothetical protein